MKMKAKVGKRALFWQANHCEKPWAGVEDVIDSLPNHINYRLLQENFIFYFCFVFPVIRKAFVDGLGSTRLNLFRMEYPLRVFSCLLILLQCRMYTPTFTLYLRAHTHSYVFSIFPSYEFKWSFLKLAAGRLFLRRAPALNSCMDIFVHMQSSGDSTLSRLVVLVLC